LSRRYQASCDDCGLDRTFTTLGHATRALVDHDCRTAHRRSCRGCGWTVTSRTAGIADRAKRAHSCERQMLNRGARLRGEFRRSLVDRAPKPCLHLYADHQHGTYACYVQDECRCEPCSAANRDYEANRTRQQAYGRWNGLVDAGPAREHVRALMAQGMGLKRIVEVSDLSQGMLWKLLYGKRTADGTRTPSRRIRPVTEARVLAVELDLAEGARIDAAASTRRVQALVAAGWSMSRLAERLGIHPGNFTPLAHGTRQVTVETAKAVHALYAELVDVAPPSERRWQQGSVTRARRYATEHGWAPPLRIGGRAWIGSPLDVDDPAEAAS
jgi:hypothetical protein